MIKIEMENELGLEVYINGIPDLKEMPPEKLESFIAVLEMQISKYYEKDKQDVKIHLIFTFICYNKGN